jgi:hypothetical protein
MGAVEGKPYGTPDSNVLFSGRGSSSGYRYSQTWQLLQRHDWSINLEGKGFKVGGSYKGLSFHYATFRFYAHYDGTYHSSWFTA